MRRIRLFLVHMSPATRPVVLAAAREVFPGAEVVEVNTVSEAEQRGAARHPELLVLTEPDTAAVAQAIQAVDPSGVPRWAVVILGRDHADLAESVPPEEWNPPLLARVFRSLLLQHELLCENLRLQGDLRTVARRISHDLYTPVGCIYTSSHVLKIIVGGDDAPSVAVMVRNIEDSSAEISQIIDRVSFVLRASADPSSPTGVEMAGVVAGVLRQLEADIQNAGAAIAQPTAWPEVSGVPQWLHVIWWNLLKNALKHSGPGAEVRLAWQPEPDGYRFSVINRGTDLAPALQAGLFRPFDQLHLRPTSGLGLSIVQRLVALQGGQCGYEGLKDNSSVFYFTVPAEKPSRPRPRRDQPARENSPPPAPAAAGVARHSESAAKAPTRAFHSAAPASAPSTR